MSKKIDDELAEQFWKLNSKRRAVNRNHVYLYTVEIRETKKQVQVEASNIWQVAGKLKIDIDDIHYLHKVIL